MFRKSKAFIAVLMVAAMLASTCSAATYTVKKGDTLWALSRKNGITVQNIVDANPSIKDPNLIYVDQKLEIPEKGQTANVPTSGTATLTIRTDGSSSITDEQFNQYFGGDAATGVAALAASGAVRVNGDAVDGTDVYINGAPALWKNEDGTWSWKTHIMRHGENLSYEQASADFIWGMSKLRGPEYTITLQDGKAVAIDFAIYDAAFAVTVTRGEQFTTVTLAGDEGDGSMNRKSPDEILFPNALVEADSAGVMPSDQCLIIYWEDVDGWHLKRADSKTVTMKGNEKNYTDSLINLEYSQPWNRPTQPIYALGWMGVESDEMIQWYLCDGIISAISHPNAKEDLASAIVVAKDALNSVAVSATGTDVAAGEMWVTPAYHDTFAQAIADAETALATEGKLNSFYEEAFFRLALSYGGDGSHYASSGNVFSDGIGFMTFAENHVATGTGITGVKAIGFVDADGAKVRAIEVEYNTDMTSASISADTYEIAVNGGSMSENMGTGEIGDITNIYTDGSKVVIEVYTDYLLSSEQTFTTSMCVGATQVADIAVGGKVIPASDVQVTNYEETESYNSWKGVWTTVKTVVTGTYTIEGIEGFQYFTNNTEYGTPDGPAYHVEHCFDEKSGEYNDHDVGYALYVPEDYDPSGSYAMVVIDNPAVNDENTHPLESVLTTRSPALLASEYGQNLVKENWGLDGLIVVVPVVAARVDDNACTPSQYEALLALWDHIQEEYSIDENHVYGIGQSVGGMVLMETNRNRDNYFAGILMFENQWAQNYYKDTLFVRNQASDEKTASTAPMHYPRTDADITWDFYYDAEGNKVYEDHDPYNLYYLVSDDNIMVMNRSANNLSNNTWNELSCLYQDTVGASVEQLMVSEGTVAEQEAQIEAYLAKGNESGLGLYWVTFENGSNGYSARRVNSGYEWLLSQSRETAMAREKLDINKPFELADEQIQTEDRATAFTDQDGNTIYVKTAKAGSGTQFYNTSWLNLSAIADAEPGWLPEGMSWETGVEAADIVGVTALDGAVAIEYSVDMADIVINLKGDDIIGLDGNVREDIKIVLDPYKFYDADGNEIECAITNVYVNSAAATVDGAERGSGSGHYVIVEIDSATAVAAIKQVTTVRTNTAISTAIDKLYQ